MAKRRKHRTHLKGANNATASNEQSAPKSFVVKHGPVGASLSQLVRDIRKVMEPNTASRLRERSRNKLKDYLVLAPALNVSHLLAFTLTPIAPSLRIVRLSAGPTLSFRVEKYSLITDIARAKRTSRSIGLEYLSPPLLVLSSFPQPSSPDTPPHISLLIKAFQSLFPPLSPKTLQLSSARRVVLISYNAQNGGTIDWRHFLITVKPVGVSRRVRKIVEGSSSTAASTAAAKSSTNTTHTTTTTTTSKHVLDLGKEKDIADFLLRKKGDPSPSSDAGGYESAASSGASDIEGEGGAGGATIDLADDYVGRNNKKGQRRAVRLDEVGPRLELRLTKITEGVPGKEGKVIFHEFVKKTKKELQDQEKEHREREKLRKERREEQERNVARKKKGVHFDDDEEDENQDEEAEADNDDNEGQWDGEEEIEESDEEEASQAADSSESEDEDARPPPRKRPRPLKSKKRDR